jgi:hypothetical protein
VVVAARCGDYGAKGKPSHGAVERLDFDFPYHGSKEMGKGLEEKIKKDLGLK